MDNHNLLNNAEAAALLNIKPGTLNIWRSSKRYNLPYVKVGKAVRYKVEDIEAFIEKNTIEQSPDNFIH